MLAIPQIISQHTENTDSSNCKVFYEGKDITPKPLEDPFPNGIRDVQDVHLSEEIALSIEVDKIDRQVDNGIGQRKGKIEIVEDEEAYKDKPGLEIPEKLARTLKSAVLKILLKETGTIRLLRINSIYLDEEEKEENKKVIHDRDEPPQNEVETFSHETQTLQYPLKEQSTMTIPVIMKDNSTFVSNWDLYCSSLDKKNIPKKGKKAKFWSKLEKTIQPTIDEQVTKMFSQPKFKHACIITERLLASNNFSEKQSLFLGDPHTVSPGKCSEFKYKLEKLWAFSCENIFDKTVTSLSWNPAIEGNIAVGYGTFDFQDPGCGLVCLWSILNPCQPEQTHKFEHSVNDVKFSKELPHILAVACFDGSIWIIDVSLNSKIIIEGYQLHHLGPVWKLEWVVCDDLINEEEIIISAGNDGRICKWDICNKFGCSLLLRLRYGPEKKIKQSVKEDVMIGDHYLSGLSLSIDPKNSSIYYVGTGQGFLVKCSTNLHDTFQEILMAHQGPVYSIQFSPFCQKIILTCGGDWTMRLWIEGILEPILIIRTAMEAVMGAVWSPVHSTIIASISGNELALWDISRKMLYPLRVVSIKKDCIFSTIEFTQCGNNIVAGDDEGNVHVYNLQEMPHIPYHQEKFLIDSLKNYLKSKPKLFAEIEKL